MIMKANKQIGFIYKNEESIDKILKDGEVVFERGFLREKTSTTLPITFGGVGKDLKDYRVYGNTYQNSTTGKNLRYIKDGTAAGVSLTYDNKSGKISIRGTATRTDGILLSEGGEVNIPAGTYTLSVSEPLPVLINSVVSLSSSTNVAFRMPAGNTSVTVNVSSDGVLVGLYFAVTKDVTYNFDFYLQLEKGSVVTEFEPFTNGASPNPGYPQEMVSCGDRTKNLFDKTSEIVENKYYTDTGEIANSTGDFISEAYIPVQTGNYTLSASGSTILRICTYDSSKTFIRREIATSSTLLNIAINSNEKYVRITGKLAEINSMQLEEGSTATSYEPYGYKIPVNVNNSITNIYLDEPLRKIDEYSDYIDFVNDKVVRQLGEIVLNGSESWGIANGILYRTTTSSLIGSGINVCSTHFIGASSQGSTANVRDNNPNNSICTASSGSARLYIKSSQFDSESSFKTWLQSNNVTVDYVLETPTEESITLPNIPTIDGNNTLNIETEITPSKVYIKYKSNT